METELKERAGLSCSIPISDGEVVTPVGHKGEIDCLIEGAGMRRQSWWGPKGMMGRMVPNDGR